MLQVEQLETGYGKKQVLFGLSLDVCQGETAAIIGPNGAGKSTVLKAICGLIQPWKGEIRFQGELLNGSTPAKNVRRGITFAPQGNRVFPDMTVMENLEIGGYHLPKKVLRIRIEHVVDMFPILRERPKQVAGKLSGGEQQMVALARALIPKPKLLMLDEPSLGLSPGIVKDVFERIQTISRETGISILIVEQKVKEVLAICNRVYSLRLGKVFFTGTSDTLKHDNAKIKDLFL
ncbi:MAG: ABC transporter ATP-binding protein [Sedimentisphaerales bacterium]|nr:ABC transporter ATP-binding protein [Sedimentisphaerales bacterium]